MNPLRRLFVGAGKLPQDLAAELVADGLLLLEQGLPGSATYRRYRAPGRYSSWYKEMITGAIGISGQRLIVWDGRIRQVDIPVSLIGPSGLLVAARRPDQ